MGVHIHISFVRCSYISNRQIHPESLTDNPIRKSDDEVPIHALPIICLSSYGFQMASGDCQAFVGKEPPGKRSTSMYMYIIYVEYKRVLETCYTVLFVWSFKDWNHKCHPLSSPLIWSKRPPNLSLGWLRHAGSEFDVRNLKILHTDNKFDTSYLLDTKKSRLKILGRETSKAHPWQELGREFVCLPRGLTRLP